MDIFPLQEKLRVINFCFYAAISKALRKSASEKSDRKNLYPVQICMIKNEKMIFFFFSHQDRRRSTRRVLSSRRHTSRTKRAAICHSYTVFYIFYYFSHYIL